MTVNPLQSRTMSLVESVANIAVGYALSIVVQIVTFPAFGFSVSFSDNLAIGAIFTIVSLIRSFALRRFFNWISASELGRNHS